MQSCSQADIELLHSRTQEFVGEAQSKMIYTAVFTAMGTLLLAGLVAWIYQMKKREKNNVEILRGIQLHIRSQNGDAA